MAQQKINFNIVKDIDAQPPEFTTAEIASGPRQENHATVLQTQTVTVEHPVPLVASVTVSVNRV